MPTYEVLKQGFYEGKLYDPAGKRPLLHTDKPFPSEKKVEQVPKWLKRVKGETAAQKKKREAESKLNAEKVNSDQKDIDEASFLGGGEQPESIVETL